MDEANFFVKKLAKSNKFELYNNLKDTSIHKKSLPHRTVIYDKTGFKIEENSIRLSISKELKQHLKEKHKIKINYPTIETRLDLSNLNI